ncbi:SIR2 family NAD-dependent protein deacylase [Spiribacter pallidus]|uniref:SIR2 family protein n=1 Tax=Spiribacter pallidus TaxID=1987936 RepID=A0ABV3TCK5_9GAMM
MPIPKNHWDGLVYLHGLLPDTNRAGGSDRLVLSGGDFGLAYLTESWAARFVSELVRRYTVCFVGYSVSDPVMRYISDAVAADRESGESLPPMFAFVGYQPGTKAEVEEEWAAKDITPVPYLDEDNHKHLHHTLHAWAVLYRDGLKGKLQIINQAAMSPPHESTQEDDFVGRVLWAISDPGGKPARHFADLTSASSIEWLEPLSHRLWLEPDAGGTEPETLVAV